MHRVIVVVGIILMCACENEPTDLSKKNIPINHRGYDSTSSYLTNPVDNLPITDKKSNSSGKKLKIEGKKITLSDTPPPLFFELAQPTLIKTKGIIQFSLKTDNIKGRSIDSNEISTPTKLIGKRLPAQLTKIITTIPPLSPSKPPIYKGKAIKNIKYLDVKQGANSSYIWDVYIDSRNQIWTGTNGGGVSVYTGNHYRHYTEKSGLSNDFVWCIEEDREGNMWFGTWEGGVSMFDGNHFFELGSNGVLKANNIKFIHEDSEGVIWIGSKNHGITKYNGKNIITIGKKEGLLDNQTNCIMEDHLKRKWIGTEKGISIIDDKTVTHLTTKDGLKSNQVNKIIEDQQGRVWIAYNSEGIDLFQGDSLFHYNTRNILPNDNIYDIIEDPMGSIWIATYGGGICKVNNSECLWLNETNGMTGAHILSMEYDNYGNIWAGTDGDGVNIINLNSFENLNSRNGIINDYIYSIIEDRKKQIWFGGEQGEVMIYKNDKFYQYEQFDRLIENQINTIYEDSKGIIWIGTQMDGVFKINHFAVTHYKKENGLISNEISEIIEGDDGLLWFGSSSDGLCSFDGSSFRHYNKENGLYSNKIWSSTKDRKGNIWFGTWGSGLIKYDGTYFSNVTEQEGLHGSVILSSFSDSKGNLWFGSDAYGACRFDGEDFHYYSTKNGLSNNKVWSIIEDTLSKSIWIGTEKGLNQLTNYNIKSKNNNTCYTYDWNDGIRSVDFLRSCAVIDQKGILWWGTGKGLTKLDRNELINIKTKPVIRLRDVLINDLNVDYLNPDDTMSLKTSYEGVEKFENVPKNLRLSYENNHMTFIYSGTDWFKPNGILYRYMIEGIDRGWSNPTTDNSADFTNIPYGNYIFKVQAKAADGTWTPPVIYPFEIAPPWWHTWTARVGYVLVATVIIWLFILQRTRSFKLRQLFLVKEIKKATQEIREKNAEVERQKNHNMEMSKRILEQDKQLILSATANTVAHGLNSPLGVIKAGAEGLIYLYNDIFSNTLQKCTHEQIMFAYSYAKKFERQPIESGKELRKRQLEINEILVDEYGLKKKTASSLSNSMSKIYLKSEIKSLIEFIIAQDNQEEVIQMMISLVSFEKITSNTLNATERSSKVVESLKKALKQWREEEFVDVFLNNSISAVIVVLQQDLNDRADIEININRDHRLNKVNQYKIFQLWSNVFTILLKSADNKIKIEITSIQQEKLLRVIFKVDIKLNEHLFEDSIYDIIMNRQQNYIDLSRAVIKNIVQENKGFVNIQSNKNGSTFEINFPYDDKKPGK